MPPIPFRYRMTEPDEPVLLYEGGGAVALPGGSERLPGDLRIVLDWVPSPRISFSLLAHEFKHLEPGRDCLVETDEPRSIEGLINGVTVTGTGPGETNTEVKGLIRFEESEPNGPLDHVTFNVANHPDFHGEVLTLSEEDRRQSWVGRNVYGGSTWKLILDSLPRPTDSVASRLRGYGFAITHVGKLERKDGSSFTVDDAKDILRAISKFLSFVRGAPSTAILPAGIGFNGDVAWEQWPHPSVAPWRGRTSPFPEHVTEGRQIRHPRVEPVFAFFTDRWNDERWAELLRLGVGWYVTANDHSSSETKIILAQAGLELAAWTAFIPDRLSKEGFNRLPAHDILRLLASEAQLPTEIPPFLSNAKNFAGEQRWEDGPRTVTEIRNLLVHPTKKLRSTDVPPPVLIESAQLAMWYLEAVLLFILQYDDEYVPNVGWARVEDTPWENPLPVPPLPERPHFPPLPR